MKKTLLSIIAAASSIFAGMANEYTFVFDGENDMGGLTRQTSTKEADLTFADSFSMTEEGIELTLSKISETGLGFALINAGGTNAGLCVYPGMVSSMTPEITLKVPNGKITSVTLIMSGSALNTLDIPFNGTIIEPELENGLASWNWEDKDGAETVTCTWANNYYARYIHSLTVEYTPDLGGKKECGLSFKRKTVDSFLGEDFTAPSVSNPNNLKIQWTSSNEDVATVDGNGKITMVARGTTIITASTEGNDEYAPGNAKYELCVIPVASNITELKEFAPVLYDRVKVNFPAIVNFGYGSIAFVTDSEGNSACFDDMRNRNSSSTTVITIYQAGQVIPAGWVATNATIYESIIWEGLPQKSTETVEVSYPVVTSITKADADRVVILQNVTFDKYTASGNTKAFGTTPDGTRYEFQDNYDVSAKPAGTYNVTGVVRYSKVGTTEYFYIAPIEYTEAGTVSVKNIESDMDGAAYYNLQGIPVAEPKSGIFVKVTNGKSVKILK